MAQIDLLLARLAQSGATGATMRGDAPIEMLVAGRQSQGAVVPAAMLRAIVEEIVPEAQRVELERRRVFQFTYSSPHGPFDIVVNNSKTEKLEVTVRPTSTSGATASVPAPASAPSARSVPAPDRAATHPGASSQTASVFSLSALWVKVKRYFKMPWGIVTAPVAAYLAIVLAMIFAPLILALAASKYVWDLAEMPKSRRQLGIAGILCVGLTLNAALITIFDRLTPNPAPVATAREDLFDPSRPAPTNPPRVAAAPVEPSPQQQLAAPAPSRGGVNDLTVDNMEFKEGAFGMGIVIGTIRNTGTRTFKYVQVEISGYDETGGQVGSTMANINNLEPGGRWNFETLPLTDKAVRVKIKDVTAW